MTDRYFHDNAVLSKFSRNYMNLKKDLPISLGMEPFSELIRLAAQANQMMEQTAGDASP